MAGRSKVDHSRHRSIVPRVEGLPVETAGIMLRNAGFERILVHLVSSHGQEDHVVGQNPAYGMLSDTKVQVQLQVARTSWVTYLPTVYQQSASVPGAFLGNFLYIFQHIYAGLERRLGRIHELFDPETTDAEFVPWLASWVGLVMAAEWDDHTRRRWVREAPRLYAHRGTAECLRQLIKIFTGLQASLEENRWPYEGFRVGVSGRIGLDSVVIQPVNRAHAFIVDLPIGYGELSEQQVLRLHQVIQMEKPAHTTYFVRFHREAGAGVMGGFMKIGAEAIGVGQITTDTEKHVSGDTGGVKPPALSS